MFGFLKKKEIYVRYIIISNENNILIDQEKLQVVEDYISKCTTISNSKSPFEIRIYNENVTDVARRQIDPILSKKVAWSNNCKPSKLMTEVSAENDIKYVGFTISSPKLSISNKIYPNFYMDVFYDSKKTHTIHLAIKKEMMERKEFKDLRDKIIDLLDTSEIYKAETPWESRTLYRYIDSFGVPIHDKKLFMDKLEPKDNWQLFNKCEL